MKRKLQHDENGKTEKQIKAPKGSGFYLLEIPKSERIVPDPVGKPTISKSVIRKAVKRVGEKRALLLREYQLRHAQQ